MKKIFGFLFLITILACEPSNNEPKEPEQVNIISELDYFEYKRDEHEGTITLSYRVTHTNNSSFDVEGYSRVNLAYKGQEHEMTWSILEYGEDAHCPVIVAGGTCVEEFEDIQEIDEEYEEAVYPDGSGEIVLVNYSYTVTNELR